MIEVIRTSFSFSVLSRTPLSKNFYIIINELVTFVEEKSRTNYLILYDRKYRHIKIFKFKNSRKKIIKSWENLFKILMILKIPRHDIDLFRRSMIIRWRWREGFDKRMKFVEEVQYYELWHDWSCRKIYRDSMKKKISYILSTISLHEIDHLITTKDFTGKWDLYY